MNPPMIHLYRDHIALESSLKKRYSNDELSVLLGKVADGMFYGKSSLLEGYCESLYRMSPHFYKIARIFFIPLNKMPLLINEGLRDIRDIALWRLEIGK